MQEPAPFGSGLNLEILMFQYQRADESAAAALIGAVSPPLLRFFSSQMGDRDEAEDMLQDAWIKIHKARHTYRQGEPVLPWVYAIARHVRVDRYRKRRRVAANELSLDELPQSASYHQPGRPQMLPDFDSMVASLPSAQREVVTMLKVGGLSIEEVARATQSTAGAVKQKAHRAYQRLRTLLGPACLANPGEEGIKS